jgi:hypothetical protein
MGAEMIVRARVDRLHEAAVNALIPEAVSAADASCVLVYGDNAKAWDPWHWDYEFHSAMTRLTVAAGLRTGVHREVLQ